MNVNPQLKRVDIVSPVNPTATLGSGTVQWSTLDGMYAVKADDTGVIEMYLADMIVFHEDLELILLHNLRRAA